MCTRSRIGVTETTMCSEEKTPTHIFSLVSSTQQASTSTSTSTWQASTSTSTSSELILSTSH